MTTTYNVNIVGNLANNNGILSNFSTGNYAKLPTNFNPSNNPWEIVFNFTTGNNFSSEVCIVSQTDTNWNGLKLDIDNGHLWFAVNFTDNTSGSITGNTTLNTNTTYYVKIIYNTTNYRMFISTDGINFTLDETMASTKVISIPDDFTIGWMKCAPSRYFNGSINLNGSYIKINNMLWWQGATSTSQAGIKIQLRHDTAANWTSVNPVLLEGEVGIETDTKKQKIGDGSTPWNNLAYDLGSTALQVSGGTMTGGIIVEDTGATAIVQKYPNITYNTAPSSSNTYGGFAALDTNLNWMGIWAVERYADNHTVVKMQGKSRTGAQGRLQLVSRTDGSWVAQAPTPLANSDTNEIATTEWTRDIADGQPVAVDQLLTTSTAIGSYNIDISSYLPNDSYDYEIILNGDIYNSNSTYGQVWLSSSKSTAIIVSNAGTNKRLSEILAPLVVSTNREITMQIVGHSIDWQSVSNRQGLYLVSYRRLGTNS